MPKPRMSKRTALDVVLGQPAPTAAPESENGTSTTTAVVDPERRDEEPTSDEAEGTEPVPAPTADAAPPAESTTLLTPGQDEDSTVEVEDGQRKTSEMDEEDEPTESAEPEPLPTPEPAPSRAASKPRPRRQAAAAPSLEESDPRFQPVLGRNDDAALVPFSTRLTPDLRRRLKLYSAVSGESTTSLTNRALDYMLEVAERKVGMR